MDPNWPGGPPPGWYPDPAGQKAWRWWDGYQWTGYASDPAGPGLAGPVPGAAGNVSPPYGTASAYGTPPYGITTSFGILPSAHDQFKDEQNRAVWARWVLPLYVLGAGLAVLSAWWSSARSREIFHQIRVQIDTGVVQHINTAQPARVALLNLLILALNVVFYVFFLRWQFRAAKTARLLLLPAKHSAGLGVGGWFIPVVSLWFPYQGIRDCLPSNDPGRAVVARLWASHLSSRVVLLVASILAIIGNPGGFPVAAVGLALAAAFALEATRATGLIADAHRRLLEVGPTSTVDRPQ